MTKSVMQNHRHLPAFILLQLAKSDNYGSSIRNNLLQEIPDFQGDTAVVYRALSQLEKDGAVEFTWHTHHPGPARKVYRITSIGYMQLAEWKKDIQSRIKKLTYFLNTYEELSIDDYTMKLE